MELDVVVLTREDVQKVELYKNVRMAPQKFIGNAVNTVESGIKLVGFGFFGAYRNINGTGTATCLMTVGNVRTGDKQEIDILINKNEFDIFSFFLDTPML